MYTRLGAVSELQARLPVTTCPSPRAPTRRWPACPNDIRYVAEPAAAALAGRGRPARPGTECISAQRQQGAAVPAQRVRLPGPPIARACTPARLRRLDPVRPGRGRIRRRRRCVAPGPVRRHHRGEGPHRPRDGHRRADVAAALAASATSSTAPALDATPARAAGPNAALHRPPHRELPLHQGHSPPPLAPAPPPPEPVLRLHHISRTPPHHPHHPNPYSYSGRNNGPCTPRRSRKQRKAVSHPRPSSLTRRGGTTLRGRGAGHRQTCPGAAPRPRLSPLSRLLQESPSGPRPPMVAGPGPASRPGSRGHRPDRAAQPGGAALPGGRRGPVPGDRPRRTGGPCSSSRSSPCCSPRSSCRPAGPRLSLTCSIRLYFVVLPLVLFRLQRDYYNPKPTTAARPPCWRPRCSVGRSPTRSPP